LTNTTCGVGALCPATADATKTYYFFSTLFGGQPLPPETTWPSLAGSSYIGGRQVPVGALTIGTPDCHIGDKPQVLLAEGSGVSGGLTWPCSGSFQKAGIPDGGGFVWLDLGDAPVSIPFAATVAYGVALDPVGDVFAVGGTNTADLHPYMNYAGYSGINYGTTGPWILKLGGLQGDQIYATALGTNATVNPAMSVNAAKGIAVDTSGDAYVVGTAISGILTTTGVAHPSIIGGQDAFVVKLNKPASAFDYATYLGGTGDEQGLAIAIDTGGSAYITGSTTSTDLPVINGITDSTGNEETSLLGAQDAFLARLTPNASAVTMMAYLGGASTEQGNGIALDQGGKLDIYVAGTTTSVDFPVVPANPAQKTYSGGTTDAFVAMISGASFPQASVSPTALSFGSQNVGTAAPSKTVTLTNSGNGILSITSIGIVGTSGDYSAQNDCGNQLSPAGGVKDHCTITVTFTPTQSGSRSDVLQIVDNSANTPQIVALTGSGVVVQGLLQLSPSSLAFGNQQTGTTSTAKSVTLTNSSASFPLTINGITLGGDFKQTNNCPVAPSTLAANASCTINVTFAPVNTGAQSVSLTVNGAAANSPQSITVTGTGTAPGSNGSAEFTLTSSTPSISMAYTGGSAQFNVFAAPLNGFKQTLNFTCALPGGATCKLAPATLSMDGNSIPSVTATVTIAGSGGTPPVKTGDLRHGLKMFESVLPFCVMGVVVVGRKRRMIAMLLGVLLVGVIFTASCGGGGSSLTSNSNSMTPGVYQVTVTGTSTGTGSLTHSVVVTMTVN
jgi:hypothetical protein